MNEFQNNWVMRDTFEKLLATAKLRLKLLKELNQVRINEGASCPVCKIYPEIGKDNHAAGCELAEEVKAED